MREEIAESELKVYSNKLTDTGFVIGLLALTAIGIFITSMSWQDEMWLLFIIGVLVIIFSIFLFIPFFRRLFSTKPLFTMSPHGVQVHMHAFPVKSFPIRSMIQWSEIVLAGFVKVRGVKQVLFYDGQGKMQLRLPVPAAHVDEIKVYIKRRGIEVKEVM